MTLAKFRSFDARMQVTMTLLRGLFLAQRWGDEGMVTLFYMANEARGFFVEIGQDAVDRRAVVLRSFSEPDPLEEYAHRAQLPS